MERFAAIYMGGRVSAWVKIPIRERALFPQTDPLVGAEKRTFEQNGVLAILRLVLGAGVTPAAEA
jgi:hypothetical protein